MKRPRSLLCLAALCALICAAAHPATASVQQTLFQNGDLSNGANYTPAGAPGSTTDIILATPVTSLTTNGAFLQFASLNQLNNAAYTISGGTLSIVPGNGGGNSVSPNSSDAIYL